ncbi:hypothetical protein C8Q78DRAFT_1075122 [Trametes maxima]|nr:hypothetical protein C8Q78DRAFT_1075122 [Trametes maxima]
MSRKELTAASTTPEAPSLPSPHTSSEEDLYDGDITQVQGLLGSPVDIPWLGAPHDGYPFCASLSSYTQTRLCGAIHSSRDDAALWESSLTFGLLEAITKSQIPESLLLVSVSGERGNGERILSGERIFRLLLAWGKTVYHSRPGPDADPGSKDAWSETGKQVAALLERAVNALSEALDTSPEARRHMAADWRPVDDNLPGALMFMIAPMVHLTQFLWHGFLEINWMPNSIYEGLGSRSTCNYLAITMRVAMLTTCRLTMCRAGWCPYFVPDQRLYTLPTLCLLNLPHLPSYIRSSPDEHNKCTASSCTFYTVDTATYIPHHTTSSCSCEYIKPPLEDVLQLLLEGKVPVVVYDGTELRVQPSTEGPYVAISHVWADGMGSTTEAGLPRCVVERTAGLVRSLLPGTGAFWIDSLCVPGGGELRKRAIKLMASTYQDAEKVLVIDASIRATCSRSQSELETLIRIAASAWNKRVWTLQEGLLARELWFEFIEGPVNIDRRQPTSSAGDDCKESCSILGDMVSDYTSSELFRRHHDDVVPLIDFRIRRSRDTDATLEFWTLMGLLEGRTTSRPEDETLAISSLLTPQIDLNALLSVSEPDLLQERMKAFLIQLRDFPLVFTVMHMPRLSLPLFSWAPRSLTTPDIALGSVSTIGTIISPLLPKGTCTENGLLAQYYAILLDKNIKPPPPDGLLLEEEPSRLFFRLNDDIWASSAIPRRSFVKVLLFMNYTEGSAAGVLGKATKLGSAVAGSITSAFSDDSMLHAHTSESLPLRVDFLCPVSIELIATPPPAGSACPAVEKPHKVWVLLQ